MCFSSHCLSMCRSGAQVLLSIIDCLSVCAGRFVMGQWQKMYFLSMKADDKTLQCYVDVRIMQQIMNAFRNLGLSCGVWAVMYGMCLLS